MTKPRRSPSLQELVFLTPHRPNMYCSAKPRKHIVGTRGRKCHVEVRKANGKREVVSFVY